MIIKVDMGELDRALEMMRDKKIITFLVMGLELKYMVTSAKQRMKDGTWSAEIELTQVTAGR